MFFSIPRYGLRAAQDHAPAPSNLGAQAPPTAAQTANSALPAATGGPPVRALRMRESGARRRRGRRPRRISSFSSGFVHLLPNPGHGCRGPFLHPSGRWQVRIGPGLQGGSGGPSPPPALGPTPAPGGSSQSRPPWGLFWGGAPPRGPLPPPRAHVSAGRALCWSANTLGVGQAPCAEPSPGLRASPRSVLAFPRRRCTDGTPGGFRRSFSRGRSEAAA